MTTSMRQWLARIMAGMPAAVFDHAWLSAAEQTRLSWARRVEGPADLSPVLRPYATALAERAGVWPHMVLAPAFAGFLMPGSETLVCLVKGWLHVVENRGAAPVVTVYPPGALSTVEVGAILLKAWITWRGCTQEGIVKTATVRFNAVTDLLFSPILSDVRRRGAGMAAVPAPQETATLAGERAKFDPLVHTHYKFMNAARRSLLPGAQVCALVMQPAFAEEPSHGWRRALPAHRYPAHLLILTSHELIEIADERGPHWGRGGRYGSIYTYIPRVKVAGAALAERPGCLAFTLDLPQGDRIELPFAPAQQGALVGVVAALR